MQVPASFEYERATSVDHALELLQRLGPETRLLAGGHASYSRPVSANSDVVIRYDTTTSTMLFALGVSGRLAAPPTPPASR